MGEETSKIWSGKKPDKRFRGSNFAFAGKISSKTSSKYEAELLQTRGRHAMGGVKTEQKPLVGV